MKSDRAANIHLEEYASFESELFGHVKGSFTDAHADRAGKFEAAHEGTLFLDEIGNLPYHLQSKLLTAIQSRSIVRVGSNVPIPVNIRLICATNCNLEEMVTTGKFREDLLYRINTIHIEIPPLRNRKEDIIPLAQRFIDRFCKQYDKGKITLSTAASQKLDAHPWYGNIRELEHAIEKDLSKYAGQDIDFVITEFNPKRRRIIGDRKQLLVAQKAKLKEELFARIQPGDTVDGTVKNVTDFGAFIDLGGADGLLHISEMSWGRVENPKKVFKAGDQVRVLIKDIQGEKIALSLKFPEANPWVQAAEKYAVGNIVVGRVARMTDFGAFVELEPGVDALLHVSQISREHVEKPADVLRIGEEIEARVVDFNEADHKISLSIKAMMAPVQQDADVADVDISQYTEE